VSAKRLAVALCAAAMATGTGTAYAQDATGSLGTVQVAAPDVALEPSAAVPATVDAEDGVASSPTATVELATGSVGGSQTAEGSTGTVQATAPQSSSSVSASAPTSADVDGGATSDPRIGLAASSEGAPDTEQSATDSTGTLQVGGAGDQTASGSTGTAQVAYPGFGLEALLGVPTTADPDDGIATDPGTMLAVLLDPAGGSQTANDSTGTAQVGGGAQTATDSSGTAQLAIPSIDATGSVTAPTTADGGVLTGDPAAGVSLGSTASAAPGTGVLTVTDSSTASAPVSTALPAATEAAAAVPTKVAGRPQGRVNPSAFAAVARSGRLPFTGAALLPALALGLALMALGLTLRRRWVPLT
jgi:hypothetical protein